MAHETNLVEFRRIEIPKSILSDLKEIKLNINNIKIIGKTANN